MKYLESYTDWRVNPKDHLDIHQDVDDILLELKDDGFISLYSTTNSFGNPNATDEFKVKITKKFHFESPSMFNYDDIRPVVNRLTDYMNSKGWVYIPEPLRTTSSMGKRQVFRVELTYKKK